LEVMSILHYFTSLISDLKRGVISPVYLFYGEEKYLQERALKKFEEVLLPPGMRDLNLDVVDGKEVCAKDIVELAKSGWWWSKRRLFLREAKPVRPSAAKPVRLPAERPLF